MQETHQNLKNLYKAGGIVALILLLYSLVTMIQLVAIGGQPESAQEAFAMLQENRLLGLLRLDILTVLVMPLYYLLFLALYAALKKAYPAFVTLAAILGFAGVTLLLATPSVFSWLALSDRFAAATSEAQKNLLLAAGEAVLASDMWHGSGAMIGGMLIQLSAVFMSIVMLSSSAFSKPTAYIGLVMHSLDLLHFPMGFIFPAGLIPLMAIAGTLYLVWFPLLARDFFRLARSN